MQLKPIIKDDDEFLWCGPAAICAVSGRRTSEINALLRYYGQETKFTKTYMMISILEQLGYKINCKDEWVQFSEIPEDDKIRIVGIRVHNPSDLSINAHAFVKKGNWVMDNDCTPTKLTESDNMVVENPFCFYIEIEEVDPFPC